MIDFSPCWTRLSSIDINMDFWRSSTTVFDSFVSYSYFHLLTGSGGGAAVAVLRVCSFPTPTRRFRRNGRDRRGHNRTSHTRRRPGGAGSLSGVASITGEGLSALGMQTGAGFEEGVCLHKQSIESVGSFYRFS